MYEHTAKLPFSKSNTVIVTKKKCLLNVLLLELFSTDPFSIGCCDRCRCCRRRRRPFSLHCWIALSSEFHLLGWRICGIIAVADQLALVFMCISTVWRVVVLVCRVSVRSTRLDLWFCSFLCL